MPNCRAQMLFDVNGIERGEPRTYPLALDEIVSGEREGSRVRLVFPSAGRRISAGFTFIELVIATVIIGLFVALAQLRLFGLLRKNTFRAQVQEFISAMRMAVMAAAESDRRYEVIIDLAEQSFMLRQITSPDLSEVLEEDIIIENYFSDNCRVAYVKFDDGDYTNEDRAKFRAGHAGWQYGGVIVFLDSDERPHSVVVNRLSRMIVLKEGEVGLLEPKARDDVPF